MNINMESSSLSYSPCPRQIHSDIFQETKASLLENAPLSNSSCSHEIHSDLSEEEDTLSHSFCSYQIHSGASQEEELCSTGLSIRAYLTEDNLRIFNRMEKHQTFKTISTTARGFEKQARSNGILPDYRSKRPTNISQLLDRLDQELGASSPMQFMYDSYVDIVSTSENENTMMTEIYSKFMKSYYGRDYRSTLNHAFTAFPREVGFNHLLSPAQPGLFQGFGAESFEPFPVEQELGGEAVVIEDARNPIALSHLAAEFKGFGKDMEQARVQSAYDGATLVYGRNKALEYIGEPDPDGHAAVITFTTNGRSICFFAHFCAPSDKRGLPEYHQCEVSTLFPTHSYEDFKTYWKRLHNAQEYAKEAADDLRHRLKKHWMAKTTPAAVSHPVVSKDTE